MVEVTDQEVEDAMRAYFDDTHQLVEGAGAAPLAALMKAPHRQGKRMGVIVTGGNVDRDVYMQSAGGHDVGARSRVSAA